MQSKQPNEPKDVNDAARIDVDALVDSLPQPELTGHTWRQQGTMLICTSCPFTHATHIPVDYQLYGINEKGEPMLRKIVVKD